MSATASLIVVAIFAAVSMGCSRTNADDTAIVRESLEIRDAVAPAPVAVGAPSEQLMSVYMHVTNRAATPDTLFGVETDIADHAMMHETAMQGAQATMSMLSTLVIPPEGTVDFVPGRRHIMLDGLHRAFHAGDTLSVTLLMSGGRRVNVPLTVIPYDSVEARFAPDR